MKLSDLNKAYTLGQEIVEIDDRIFRTHGDGIQVTISSQYQPKEIVDLVRPAIIELLLKKRGEVLSQLAELGVDIQE
jgi:hypothetical protein